MRQHHPERDGFRGRTQDGLVAIVPVENRHVVQLWKVFLDQPGVVEVK